MSDTIEIFSRWLIDSFPNGTEVFEGEVEGPLGPATAAWVELDGGRVSGFGTVDTMLDFAENFGE